MAQNMDVGSLLRHLANGFGAGKHDVKGAMNVNVGQKTVTMTHDQAVSYVVVTLALMAQEAAEERQYVNRKDAIEHIRPL